MRLTESPVVTSRCDVIDEGNTAPVQYVHDSESLHSGEDVVRQRRNVVLVESSAQITTIITSHRVFQNIVIISFIVIK